MRGQRLGFLFLTVLAWGPRPSLADDMAARYRTGIMDPVVRRVPPEIQQGVFRDPSKYLPQLAEFLTGGANDEYHKVKRLHDWTADNIAYDVESYFGTHTVKSTSENTLLRRKAVCHGYANLMEELCEAAGLSCRTISGYGRGYAFSRGAALAPGDENHAWNAVYVDGGWRFVDVTWDAGHVQGRAYKKKYCTTYLFMPPSQFIFTHLPAEPRWQLLSKPLTLEQFNRQPYLRGVFFDHGLMLGTPLSRVTPVGSTVKFEIYAQHPVELMSKLYTSSGQELAGRTMEQSEGRLQTILVAFPAAGRYRVKLYCRRLGDTAMMDMVAELDFQSSSGTPKMFPKTYAHFNKLQGRLDSPLFVPLATGTPVLFQVRLRGAQDVRLAVGDQQPWRKLNPDPADPNLFRLKTTIPAGVRVRLNAKISTDSQSYGTLIEFSR